MSTLEGENFHSVVHLEKRVRPDKRDDFESVISRNPAAFCQQKLVFPRHPNLLDDRRSTSGIGKSHLDAFPRGDEVDVFLTPLSAFSSGCNSWRALSRNIKIN